MTGMRLTVEVDYSNWPRGTTDFDPADPSRGRNSIPPFNSENIDAFVAVTMTPGWFGTGAQPFYVEHPSGP